MTEQSSSAPQPPSRPSPRDVAARMALREVPGREGAKVSVNESTTLKVPLRKVLDQVGLTYCVKDGVLFISTPRRVEEERDDPPAVRLTSHGLLVRP